MKLSKGAKTLRRTLWQRQEAKRVIRGDHHDHMLQPEQPQRDDRKNELGSTSWKPSWTFISLLLTHLNTEEVIEHSKPLSRFFILIFLSQRAASPSAKPVKQNHLVFPVFSGKPQQNIKSEPTWPLTPPACFQSHWHQLICAHCVIHQLKFSTNKNTKLTLNSKDLMIYLIQMISELKHFLSK